jgi:spermidine/putrescine transport system permease protein
MRSRTSLLSIGLVSGWLILFGGVPLILLLLTSLLRQDPEYYFAYGFSLQSYAQLLNPDYFSVLLRSTRLALYTTLICLLVGYPFAWLTCRLKSRYRLLVLILLMIPFWTNSLIRTYAVRLIIGTQGLLNKLLVAIGLIDQPIRIMYTDTAVLLGLVYLMLPFMVLPLYATVEKLDFRLVEAARDLGAGAFSTFRRVILPMTLHGIVCRIDHGLCTDHGAVLCGLAAGRIKEIIGSETLSSTSSW